MYCIIVIIVLYVLYLIISGYITGNNRNNIVLDIACHNISTLLSHVMQKYFISNPSVLSERQLRARQLLDRFNFNNISTISRYNFGNETAITINKRVIRICLENRVYPHKIYNINSIMFVLLHELSHIATDTLNHDIKFWSTFKFLLQESAACKIYIPIDYSKYPEIYCNTTISYNPLYDIRL